MITELFLKNFQGFKGEQSVKLAPITLIFGPNASGKSSIARALQLLSDSVMGDYPNIQPRLRFSNGVGKISSFALAQFGQGEALKGEEDELRIGITVTPEFQSEVISLSSITFILGQAQGCWRGRDLELILRTMDHESWTYHHVQFEEDSDFTKLRKTVFEPILGPAPQRIIQTRELLDSDVEEIREPICYSLDMSLENPIVNSLSERLIENQLQYRQIRSYKTDDPDGELWDKFLSEARNGGAFRAGYDSLNDEVHGFDECRWNPRSGAYGYDFENLAGLVTGSLINLFGFTGDLLAQHLKGIERVEPLRALPSKIEFVHSFQRTYELQKAVNESLLALTGGRYELIRKLIPMDGDLNPELGMVNLNFVKDNLTGVTVAFDQVGMGIGQVVPVLDAIHGEGKGILIIEQPELHLHPKMQAQLATILVEQQQKSKRQLIIETHSESLLLRIQKMIREGLLAKEAVSIIYSDPISAKDVEGNVVESFNNMRNIELDNSGDILDPFPESFADLRIQDLL